MDAPESHPTSVPVGAARHILFTTIYYAPEETANAPYTAALAEYLAQQGWRVTVLTAMPHYPQWRVWDKYRGKIRMYEMICGVHVHRVLHYVPQKQSALRRAFYEISFLAHTVSLLCMSRPDVVLGTVPSLSGGMLAALAAKRFHVPYGLFFRDLVAPAAKQSGIRGGGRVARATQAIEGYLACHAAGIALVAEGFRPYLEGFGIPSDRIRLVPDWSHIEAPTISSAEMRAQLGWSAESRVVLHAGNMGLKQSLDSVVECARLAEATNPDILFVMMGDGNQRSHLEHMVKQSSLPNFVFLPLQAKDRFPNVLAAADILLLNQRAEVGDMSLPSKLTSYFMVGRPVVAAVAPDSETARKIVSSGGGIVVEPENPRALLDGITGILGDPALADSLGTSGSHYAREHLSPESVQGKFIAFIDSLIGSDMAIASELAKNEPEVDET